jgi:hypothetical protein
MGLFKEADKSGAAFAKTNTDAAASVLQFAQAASRGGDALSLLPSIISMIQAAAATSSMSGGGGLLGSLGSLFGGGGGNAGGTVATDAALELFFHRGGIVGQTSDRRPVPRGVFADAGRYHAGGMAAGASKGKQLAAHEVPAILMGGPKGTREEVLTAKDPRHRDRMTPEMAKAFAIAPRYHTGGIAGLMPDRRVDVLKPVPSPYLTAVPSGDDRPNTKAEGDTYIVKVSATQGMSREQAMNQGREIGRGMQVQMGRRSRNS